MIERLSSNGRDLLGLCNKISESVASAIMDLVGDPDGGQVIKIGADGTPTKSIDSAAENAVLSELKSYGSGFIVLSEEIGEVKIGDKPEYFVYLDPLDGTFNAIKGIPFYSVSIYFHNESCHFGYIGDLARTTNYYAENGKGAYTGQGDPLLLSKTSDLKHFSISAYTLRPNTSRINGIGDRVRRIRTLGSTSIEMAFVAAGKLDAFVDLRGMLRIVDVAAGKLILEEAGGKITDENGKQLLLDENMWQRKNLIGSNGLMHEELLHLIGGVSL